MYGCRQHDSLVDTGSHVTEATLNLPTLKATPCILYNFWIFLHIVRLFWRYRPHSEEHWVLVVEKEPMIMLVSYSSAPYKLHTFPILVIPQDHCLQETSFHQ